MTLITDGINNQSLLTTALSAAVPLWQLRYADRPLDDEMIEKAKEISQMIAEHGDNILFRSKKPGESAKAFNALAEGLAILSKVPGGVHLFGQHWEWESSPFRKKPERKRAGSTVRDVKHKEEDDDE